MWNTASGPDRSSNIEDHEYLTQSLSELPIKKVDAPLVLSKLPGCAYYQGVFSFSVNQIQAARTLSGNRIYLSGHRTDRLSGDDNFIIVDKAAMKGGIKDWCEAEYFTPPRCRGNVIVTRGCRDKPENTILRVFSIDKPGSKTFNQQEASR